jgi:hypothetical protein
MAEKFNTTTTSRRLFLAAGPAASVFDRLQLLALRQSIERTLGAMAALLDVDTPEGVAIPVRAPVRGNQRRGA